MTRDGRVAGTGCLAAILWAAPVRAEPVGLQGGSYEVEVRLELPHLEDMTGKTTRQVCLSADAGANNHGIAVLSDNNPLARCPVANVYEGGGQISFDIVCEGKNSAKAKASYSVTPGGFRGRIVMQMGGKNMTMTEVQAGRRTGPCEAGRAAVP